jgi:hypothetical protein
MHVMDEIKRQLKSIDASFQAVRFGDCKVGTIGCLAGPQAGSPVASSVFSNVRGYLLAPALIGARRAV